MGSPDVILGLDIGGTKTAAVIGTSDGEVLSQQMWPSRPARGFGPMWRDITEAAAALIADGSQPAAVGVSIGGPLDVERGIVESPPNLPGWDHIPLKEMLEDRLGVPTYVEHDARAGALAEWLFGAGRGCRDVIFLTFGTGLGAGLILDGRLYTGHSGYAGEVGHWRMARRGPSAYGKVGSWEAFSSGSGLPRLARHLFPDGPWTGALTGEEVIRLARAGDARMQRVVTLAARRLGAGIAQLIDLLDPEVVVLGSLAVRAGDLFLPEVRQVVRRECLPSGRGCRIVPAQLGEQLGNLAALSAAIYRLDGHLPRLGGGAHLAREGLNGGGES